MGVNISSCVSMENKFPFKAFIREASAGTGKTYSIIKDIIDLKNKYGSYEILKKIIGMTFSENAAIELKERLISSILNNEYKNLSEKEKVEVENILLRLNFSTIHSFGKKILKRFYFLLNIDPFFQIIDKRESNILFNEAFIKTIYIPEGIRILYKILEKIKLNRFSELMFKLKELHPYVFLGSPFPQSEITKLLSEFYEILNREYLELKKKLGYLDFNDLEIFSYEILNDISNALLILEDFDENINFIFVDEFQDTNLLQWKIIQTLLDEWKSGFGAKAEEMENYGIFIVGDKKQSIYKFRGAERSVFEEAKKSLEGFYISEKLKENYRSTEEIINFVNKVFDGERDWKGEELIFSGKIKNLPTKVEIGIFKEKNEEYDWICNKICYLLKKGDIYVFDRGINNQRKLELKDIIILIRKRGEKFKILEDKLKEYNIPYVILGGIGFYQESEIKFLLSLLFALIDPSDKYSIWNLKNSIFKITERKIENWRKLMNEMDISFLMENILYEIGFWNDLSIQQYANAEKFLSLLQNQSYLPYHQISKNFREISLNPQEPKADIFSVHQDAVKIMTIHQAKGLEAPVVFCPNIEDFHYISNLDDFFYRKVETGYIYGLKERKFKEFEDIFKKEMIEEEKRILYVALTRAMQFLFISGIKFEKRELFKKIESFAGNYPYKFEKSEPLEFKGKTENFEIKIPARYTKLSSFTKEKKNRGTNLYETIVGTIIHKIIHQISNGFLEYDDRKIKERVIFYLKKETEKPDYYIQEILKIFEKIKENKEIERVINEKVSDKVKSEFPFIYEIEDKIYEGVIDKIFIEKDKIKIYEFKTYLKSIDEYRKQLEIYKNGVRKIFNKKMIECYIINLAKGEIIKLEKEG